MHPEPEGDTDRIDDAVLALLFLGTCTRDRMTGAGMEVVRLGRDEPPA